MWCPVDKGFVTLAQIKTLKCEVEYQGKTVPALAYCSKLNGWVRPENTIEEQCY